MGEGKPEINIRWVIQEFVGIVSIIYFAFELYRVGSPPLYLAVIGIIGFVLSLEPMIEHLIEKLHRSKTDKKH